MPSPFQSLANLTALFQVPSDGAAVSEQGGSLMVTTPTIVVAYAVRQRLNRQNNQPLQDGELSRIDYKGFWVNPTQAPQNIRAEQIGKAYVWRLATDFALPVDGFANEADYNAFADANRSRITAEGDFVLAPNPAGPYQVEFSTGDVFSGVLITQVAWGDAV